MLGPYNPQDCISCVIGIDPGTTTLGVGIIYFNVFTMEIVTTHAFTMNANRFRIDPVQAEIHGERAVRLMALGEEVYQLFCRERPYSVIAEDNYIDRRRPTAYGALVEAVAMLRQALYRYHPTMILHSVEPNLAKLAVGTVINRKEKDKKTPVHNAIKALPNLRFSGPVPLAQIDEHSVDGVAIAYYQYLQLYHAAMENYTKPTQTGF